jgi:hypothetical protein
MGQCIHGVENLSHNHKQQYLRVYNFQLLKHEGLWTIRKIDRIVENKDNNKERNRNKMNRNKSNKE